MRCSKSNSNREVHSYKCRRQETRKISHKQSNLTLKKLEKKQTKLKVSRRIKITKIRVEK